MGTTKNRKTRRNTSRPAAINFLTNISLGNASANTKESLQYSFHYANNTNNDLLDYHNHLLDQDDGGPSDIAALSLHSSDSSSTDDGHTTTTVPMERPSHSLPHTSSFLTARPVDHVTPQTTITTRKKQDQRRRSSSDSSHEHHKLTREDSERPIASEKIKKKSSLVTGGKDHGHGGGTSIMSVFRYYTDKIKQSTTSKRKNDSSTTAQLGYVRQQQLANNDHHKRRAGLSYAHFLSPIGTLLDDATVQERLDEHAYDPLFLDNDTYNQIGNMSSSLNSSNQNIRPGDTRKELNEQFRLAHPEIPTEITLTKIRSIKAHLLEIGKVVDLEVSTLAHAYVYFEKLVIKNVVSKKNRKLIAACCLFLAFKVNEAKGTQCHSLLEAIDDELDEDSDEIHEHEFAVFADLEFNLYIPRREFMPHFERIFGHLETKSLASYLGDTSFYQVQ
ncbi:cyclin-like protein [Chlamydoabsidia padenii]|nr:cyclin-like protein [Chlamydoabsidia padenii]